MQDHFIETNGIRLHVLHEQGNGPALLLFHGLTANAHAFDGLMAAGLPPSLNVFSVDLRGRGGSDQPEHDYSMLAHAKDIIGLLDAFKLERVIIAGHSFGGLLSLFLASHYPGRIERIILMDAAARMHEQTKEMLAPSLSRLGQVYPSFDQYLEKIKSAPFLEFWEDQMTSYYRADIKQVNGNSVTPVPQLQHMLQAVTGALAEPWKDYLLQIDQPALLINGPGIYTMNAALLPETYARETVDMMKNCRYAKVPGNHQTMLYGSGARAIVKEILDFVKN